MKTENPENSAPRAVAPAPVSDPSATHAALVAVLEEFNIPVNRFLRQRASSYEHLLAAHSVAELRQLYCLLKLPGKSREDAAREAPVWPSGKFAGRRPESCVIGRIKKRLLPVLPPIALSESDQQKLKMQVERKKLRLKEKNLKLRDKHLALEQNKFDQQLAAVSPAQPALPVSRETPGQMIERVHGRNPFKNENA